MNCGKTKSSPPNKITPTAIVNAKSNFRIETIKSLPSNKLSQSRILYCFNSLKAIINPNINPTTVPRGMLRRKNLNQIIKTSSPVIIHNNKFPYELYPLVLNKDLQ